MIFMYDLDFRRCRLLIESKLTFWFTSLLVVITIPLFVMQIKSAIISDLNFFRYLLILVM